MNTLDLGSIVCRILAAIFVSVYGITHKGTLLSWFPLVPIFFTDIGELRYWLDAEKSKMPWWFQHMSCMFTACIATVTAFVVPVGPRLLGGFGRSLLLWPSPVVIMVPILILMQIYYRKKFNGAQEVLP